ncbi:MAG TPA: YopX family protein [Pricia sp.]|nr:YopX family protein [Pricia sp.]
MEAREIKFRGQKTSTKEWVYGSLIVNKSGDYTITQITYNPVSKGVINGWCFGVMPETVGQYTGLKDRNGKEIYEGDVLSDYTETDEGIIKSHCQVLWNEACGSWELDMSMTQNRSYTFYLAEELLDFEYEISGNIYENPELLTTPTTGDKKD